MATLPSAGSGIDVLLARATITSSFRRRRSPRASPGRVTIVLVATAVALNEAVVPVPLLRKTLTCSGIRQARFQPRRHQVRFAVAIDIRDGHAAGRAMPKMSGPGSECRGLGQKLRAVVGGTTTLLLVPLELPPFATTTSLAVSAMSPTASHVPPPSESTAVSPLNCWCRPCSCKPDFELPDDGEENDDVLLGIAVHVGDGEVAGAVHPGVQRDVGGAGEFPPVLKTLTRYGWCPSRRSY